MTEKEDLFIKEYLKDFNGRQAAIRAGYSERSATEIASENLRKPHIKEKLDEYKKEISDASKVALLDIIKDLQEIKDRCMVKEPVMEYDHNDKCMKPTGEWTFKEGGALKAVELLGKTIGAFNEANKHEIAVEHPIAEELKKLRESREK